MAANKVGALIKSARTDAGFTQEELAKKIDGLSASAISKAERGEAELTKDQLKAIAKATGVTQKSLLEAAEGKSTSKTSESDKKSGSAKSSESSKASSSEKSSKKDSDDDDLKLTATEKKLVELYRAAESDTKKNVMKLLKGEETTDANDAGELISSILGTVVSQLGKK